MRVALVTTFCPHYRVKTYETLARAHDVDYYFFSEGRDWYWQWENGIRIGDFKHPHLRGFSLGRTRITPELPFKLLSGDYDVYVKCINGKFALPTTFLAARLRRKPFILWTGIWTRIGTPLHRLLLPMTRYIYRHADAIVAYGEHVKRYLVGEGVTASRIFVAPHAVDNSACGRAVPATEVDEIRFRLGLRPSQRMILYVGRLEESKGLRFLVRAFGLLTDQDAILVMVGAGELRPSLEALVAQLGISDRIRFPGHAMPEETAAWYAGAWVCVLPSITTAESKEPWGLTVNEAFNQGVPVIATDAVGAAAGGLVRDGANGLIVPERNVEALAAAIQRLLDDPDLRASMSRAAGQAIQSWSVDEMVRGFVDAIESVAPAERPD